MKGIALAWGGILIICLVSTLIVYYMVGQEDQYMKMMVEDSKIISFSNSALLADKMYDEGLTYVVERATYDYGKEGGGFTLWSKDVTLAKLQAKLDDRISNVIDFTNAETTMAITGTVTTKDYSATECGGDITKSSCFYVDGTRELLMGSDELKASIDNQAPISKRIGSTYFKLLQVGLDIFDITKPYYSKIENAPDVSTAASDLRKQLGITHSGEGLRFTTAWSSNQITLTIEDLNNKIYVNGVLDSLKLIIKINYVPKTCTVSTDCPYTPCKTATCDTTTKKCVYTDNPSDPNCATPAPTCIGINKECTSNPSGCCTSLICKVYVGDKKFCVNPNYSIT